MLSTFVKTYSNRTYKHVTTVRHKGTVIALALDDQRHIHYSVLDLQNRDVKSPLDVNFWLENPKELSFPNEIAEVGFGVADQTLLPVVKKGSTKPEASGHARAADGLFIWIYSIVTPKSDFALPKLRTTSETVSLSRRSSAHSIPPGCPR